MVNMAKNTQNDNNYIARTKSTVNGSYRLTYHMMPPIGWLNDPNGLVFFKDRYHLYYQYNPYASCPGRMVWGHFVSQDLISYIDDGVALKPDIEGASAYSGGAIDYDNGTRLAALYTLHQNMPDGSYKEEVYKAKSHNGFGFDRGIKIFDNEYLPDNLSRSDFRDPCPVLVGDTYYVFVGGKDVNLNKGVIVVLSGKTLDRLHYAFCLGPYYQLGEMCECPCYFRVDGKDVILACGCNVPERDNDFKNVNSSVFIVGELDFDKGTMAVDYIKEIDKGDAFYAPQFIRGIAAPIMIGWLEMWERKYPTREKSHGWVGAFSIPREISIRDGDVFQNPVNSLDNYLRDVTDQTVPKCADIRLRFDGEGYIKIIGNNGCFTVGKDSGVYLDTNLTNNLFGCVRRTNRSYDVCDVRILLDVSSVEVFVDDGREVISSRIYIDGDYKTEVGGNVSQISIKEVVKQ